jgi:hypothetical protein
METGQGAAPSRTAWYPGTRTLDPETLIIAALGSFLALTLSPIRALCAYLCVLLLHTQDLDVSIGVIDFSSARIVLPALAANVIFRAPHLLKSFRWSLLDTSVVLLFVGQVVSLFFTEPFMRVLENRSGHLLETVMPYFLCRAVLRSKKDLLMLIKTLILISLPLAFFGVVETTTGHNYIGSKMPPLRDGHFRAYGTFSVHISFGIFFASVIPLCISLWNQRVWSRVFLVVCICCCMAGLISSWSSGPILALYFSVVFLCSYPIRRAWPILLVAGFALIVLVDNLSNRRWYEVPTRFLLSSSTAYYRIELYKEAFGGGMTDHWLCGYGLVANAYSSYKEFPWVHRDMTSIYIKVLAVYGLTGLVPFLIRMVLYYSKLVDAYTKCVGKADKWMIWCIAATLMGLDSSFLSINCVSKTIHVHHILIAISGSFANFPSSFKSELDRPGPRECGKNHDSAPEETQVLV